jgi:hypothetical protein
MTEKLCYLLGINNFDLANIFDINEYNKIKESNSNEILTSEHLTPPFTGWRNEYKYYREQRLQKNNIRQGELIENPYTKGSELICDFFEFKENNTYGDIEFKLHIGGEGKKCPDIILDFKEEEFILMGVLDKLEQNINFENFNDDLREKLKAKITHKPQQSTINLSEIFKNYSGTVFAVCCRKFYNKMTQTEKDAVRILSNQPSVIQEDIENNTNKLFCMNYMCNETIEGPYEIGPDKKFKICQYCNRFYCDNHINHLNHNCIGKCELDSCENGNAIECINFICKKRLCIKDHFKQHFGEHFKDPSIEGSIDLETVNFILVEIAVVIQEIQKYKIKYDNFYVYGTKEYIIKTHLEKLEKITLKILTDLNRISFGKTKMEDVDDIISDYFVNIMPEINLMKEELRKFGVYFTK